MLTKIKSGIFRIPSTFSTELSDLISKMLTVEPSLRISINDIKNHPIIKKYSPENYFLPKPFPIPYITEKIDIINLPSKTLQILKNIGYESDEEIIKELTSNNFTPAKGFIYLLSKTVVFDGLNWPSQDPINIPIESFLLSPNEQSFLSLNNDEFGRKKKKLIGTSSPINFSFVQKSLFDFDPKPEYDQLLNSPQIFTEIPLRPENLWEIVQKYLDDINFEWLHPTDLHLYVKNNNTYFLLSIDYETEETINLSIFPIKDPNNKLLNFSDEVSNIIKSIL